MIFISMDLQLIDQSNHISLCREIIQNSQEDSEHNGVLFGGPALPNRSAENTTRRLSQCGRCTSHINNSQPAVSASVTTNNHITAYMDHWHWGDTRQKWGIAFYWDVLKEQIRSNYILILHSARVVHLRLEHVWHLPLLMAPIYQRVSRSAGFAASYPI